MKPQKIGRRPIGPIQWTGVWPLLKDDVVRVIRDWPEDFIVTDADLFPLLIVALDPRQLSAPASRGLRREFARIYSAHPDFVLTLLTVIRRLWLNPKHKFIVKKFILSRHGLISDTPFLHVNSADAKEGTKETEIRRAIKKLTGIFVSPATVKRARQELARRSLGR